MLPEADAEQVADLAASTSWAVASERSGWDLKNCVGRLSEIKWG